MVLTQSNIDVLYIGGAGRSGSTLLEMILGRLSGFFSIGEARYYWEYSQQGNILCGCGENLNDCDFWSNVKNRLKENEVDVVRMASLSRRLNRTRNAFWMIKSKDIVKIPDVKELIHGFTELYRIIWEETGNLTLVDASKIPSHLIILKNASFIYPKIIHLVRDGRAVAYSWSKRKKQELAIAESKTHMPIRSAWRSMLTWDFENIYTLRLSRNLPNTLMLYEQFVNIPAKVLGNALGDLGYDGLNLTWLEQGEFSLVPTHSVGGNPIRFTNYNVTLSPDTEWRDKMPRALQIGLGLIGLPLLTRFGYKI